MILMKNLRKTTLTNAENNMLVQKFEKKTWKKVMKTKQDLKLLIMKRKLTKKPKICKKRKRIIMS